MVKRKKNIINRFKEKEAWGIIIFIFSIIFFLSIIFYKGESPRGTSDIEHLLGVFGLKISDFLITSTIGYFSIIVPIIMSIIAYAMFFRKKIFNYLKKSVYLLFIAVALSVPALKTFQNLNTWPSSHHPCLI